MGDISIQKNKAIEDLPTINCNNVLFHQCIACQLDRNKFGFHQCETCLNLQMKNSRTGNTVKMHNLGIFCLAGIGERKIYVRDKNGKIKYTKGSYAKS